MQTDSHGSLRDKFDGFGAAPSAGLWDSIARSLDEDKKRRGAFWWWMLGSAAMVALIFSVYQIGYQAGANSSELRATENTNDKIQPGAPGETIPLSDRTEELITHTDEVLIPLGNQSENNVVGIVYPADRQEDAIERDNGKEIKNNGDQHVINDPGKKENELMNGPGLHEDILPDQSSASNEMYALYYGKKMLRMPDRPVMPLFASHDVAMNLETAVIERKKNGGYWQIGFNATALNSISDGYKAELELFDTTDDTTSSITGDTLEPWNNIAYFPPGQMKLHRPCGAELSISRSLGRRWHIQTGLGVNVARLNTTYETGDISSIKTNYVGLQVPVHFAFDFIKRRRVECYTAMGVNNEIPVHRKSTYMPSPQAFNAMESSESKKFGIGYQGSAQLSLGFRYRINEKFRLDFRPHARYYYREKNSMIPTIPQKLWVGVTAGFTWVL
jgi:hypothetical protein